MQLIAFDLHVEETRAHRVACLAGRRLRRRPVRRQSDRARAESLQRVLGIVEIPLSGLQLVFEELRQLSELFALELGRHLHVALCHGVQNAGNENRVWPPKLERQEVAIHIHADIQPLTEPQGGIARGNQREIDGAVGRQAAGLGRPEEAQWLPHRITDGPLLQVASFRGGQRVLAPVRTDAEPIIPRPERLTHMEVDEVCAIAQTVHRQIEAQIPHDLVQYDVGLKQFHPSIGVQQRSLTDRPARIGCGVAASIGDIDPHIRLRPVNRTQHPRRGEGGAQSQ